MKILNKLLYKIDITRSVGRQLTKKMRQVMSALIYDNFDPNKREKRVISIQDTRKMAESAMEKRQQELVKRVWECNTRIVWIKKGEFREGDQITPDSFETWAVDIGAVEMGSARTRFSENMML